VSLGIEPDQPAVELETWFKPGLTPWLTLASSWRAGDSGAERLDLEATARFSRPVAAVIEAGIRMVPEGCLVDGSIAVDVPLRSCLFTLGVRTVGWMEPGMVAFGTLEYWIKARTSFR
jgi:hypothetical protein